MIWKNFYLTNWKQKIKIGNSFLRIFVFLLESPQGSVLGSLLTILYTSPRKQVISSFNATHHLYADVTKLYLTIDSQYFDPSIEKLSIFLSVQESMNGVKLKLNPDKTEFIIISNKHTKESFTAKFPMSFLHSSSSVEVKKI